MIKNIVALALLNLNIQSVYARNNPVDNPEMLPLFFIMVGCGLMICIISMTVSKLMRNKSFFVAFFYMMTGLLLIIFVLFICIKLLIGIANKFGM